MEEKIRKLIRVYRGMLEREEQVISDTIGKPDKYDEWKEAVNASSCYKVFLDNLERLLNEERIEK